MFKKQAGWHLLTVIVLAAGLLAACGSEPGQREAFPTPVPQPSAGKIPDLTPGPVSGAKLSFPEDEAPHNSITEWWYYTGHLETVDGGRYGFEYVIFQGIRAEFPPGYVSHLAITDLNKKSFKYDQRLAIAPGKVAFGGRDGFKLGVNGWTMAGLAGRDRLQAAMTDNSYGLDLTLQDQKGIVLHGGGLFSYGAAGSSYYYSRPRMSISGALTVNGQSVAVKEGVAWFDHQWGDFVPLSGGWDWFSLHLDDDTELMVYYIRDDKNNVVDVFGSYVPACQGRCDPAGARPAPSVDLRRADFSIKPLGQWASPATGGIYPSGWNVVVKASNVPALDLNIKPQVLDQELDTRKTTGVIYWEGACEVTGRKDGRPITGRSYVELTGYAVNRPGQ